jgi:hypothetical protein
MAVACKNERGLVRERSIRPGLDDLLISAALTARLGKIT